MKSPEAQTEAIRCVADRLLNDVVSSIEPIGGGGNSRVYRIIGGDRRPYALKAYFRRSDNRDCLATEFDGLRFLWQNGVRNIPQPLADDRHEGYALYAYVEGRKVPASEISAHDVEAAVAFLGRLKELTRRGSEGLRPAAEACYSGEELLARLQYRLGRLVEHPSDEPADPAFLQFIGEEFLPALDRLTRWGRSHALFGGELPRTKRTLSPSDFGFHNALRREDGEWFFLDFEYFGWDEPAKMISDFLLHPAMGLAAERKRQFARGLATRFADDDSLRERLAYYYPLFGLKWCLILLNEFLPEHLRRRQFAATLSVDWRAVQREQLAKARRMLQQVLNEYEHFPYLD